MNLSSDNGRLSFGSTLHSELKVLKKADRALIEQVQIRIGESYMDKPKFSERFPKLQKAFQKVTHDTTDELHLLSTEGTGVLNFVLKRKGTEIKKNFSGHPVNVSVRDLMGKNALYHLVDAYNQLNSVKPQSVVQSLLKKIGFLK
jgi:hypothetical protein